MPDNAEWLAKLNYIDFLRDVGRHFSVNRMLAMDSVKLRLEREHELSFLEFNYMCLQAYDFTELNRRYGVTLQMGGSDQWGNIVTGIDLGRRMGLRAVLRPDLAADHHRLGREDGQDRGRRGLARRHDARALRLLAVLAQHRRRRRRPVPAGCSRCCRSTRSAGSKALEGAEINEAKKALANEATALLHGRRGGRGRRRDRAQDLRGGRARREPADGRRAGRRVRRRPRRAHRLRARRPRRLDRRSAPPDPRRGPEGQRRDARRREGAHHPRGADSRAESSSCRSAARSTCCCGRCRFPSGFSRAGSYRAGVRRARCSSRAGRRERRCGSSCRRSRRECGAECPAQSPTAD